MNEMNRTLEAMFDAAMVAADWLASFRVLREDKTVDSRDMYAVCSKVVKRYEEEFPNGDDEEYLSHIHALTYAALNTAFGLPVIAGEWEDFLLYGYEHPAEAWYCYDHDHTLYDYDCWTHLKYELHMDVSYEEFSKISGWYEDDLLEATEAQLPAFRRLISDEGVSETLQSLNVGSLIPTCFGNAIVIAFDEERAVLRFKDYYLVCFDPRYIGYWTGLRWTTSAYFYDKDEGSAVKALEAALMYKKEKKHE